MCTRCGKPRIVSKTWTEEIETYGGTTMITHSETICPDPDCQEKVDEGLKKQQQERQMMQKEAEIRAQERVNIRNRKTAKAKLAA